MMLYWQWTSSMLTSCHSLQPFQGISISGGIPPQPKSNHAHRTHQTSQSAVPTMRIPANLRTHGWAIRTTPRGSCRDGHTT